MEIEIFGQLSIDQEHRRILILDQARTVLEVAKLIGLNPELIGLITIDGVQSELHDVVMENNRLCFFPYMSGG
jgi:hypothetical protein